MICRFCQQLDVHYCLGGKLQAGDREFELYGETYAFPGLRDAADHSLNALTVDAHCASITDTGRKTAEE